jgi:CubicO group peptidase (beta-lactamase class C family)
MKKTISLLICILLQQVIGAQVLGNNETVPHTYTLPGIANPAFPYVQPEEVGISKEQIIQLGDEVANWVANGELIGGELLIIKEGKTVFHEAYGWSDREEKKPLNRNSIWSIKSMSKPFTATAIMMLSEQGKLSVNDKLTDYIPEYAGDPRTSIADLLAHTSGYMGLGNTWNYKDIGSWVRSMATLAPTEAYGTYHYSDFNFAALGYIVQLVAKMPVEEYLQVHIFNPLQLNESYTHFSPDLTWALNVNSRYRIYGNHIAKYWSNRDPQEWDFYPAAWGIWGTAMDYSKFLTMFLNQGKFKGHKVLNEATVQDMISRHSDVGNSFDYGYGFYVKRDKTNSNTPLWFGHEGVDGTEAIAYPKDKLIVVFMTHCRGTVTQKGLRDLIKMFGFVDIPPDPTMIRGKDFTNPVLPLTGAVAKEYEGYYRGIDPSNPKNEILIHVEQIDGHLRGQMNYFGLETGVIRNLIYLGQDRFLVGSYVNGQIAWIDPGMEFVFRKKNGAVVSLEMQDETTVTATEKVDKNEVDRELLALRNKKYIDDLIANEIDKGGIESARTLSRKLHSTRPDDVYFSESFLNSLGYRYLNEKEYKKAIAVFEMNVDAYNEEPNCYDSLADAWQRKGDLEKAKENYQKALNLAREQGDLLLPNFESRLNAIVDQIKEKGKD